MDIRYLVAGHPCPMDTFSSFQKILSGTLSKLVWSQIRTLIWVQTVCKGDQETTNVAASKENIIATVREKKELKM